VGVGVGVGVSVGAGVGVGVGVGVDVDVQCVWTCAPSSKQKWFEQRRDHRATHRHAVKTGRDHAPFDKHTTTESNTLVYQNK
jgi:hypothetical protein